MMLPTALEPSEISSMAILILERRKRVRSRMMPCRTQLRIKRTSHVVLSCR
jgi:hypothetical protein